MSKPKVAILRTTPKTVLADYAQLMKLAGFEEEFGENLAVRRLREICEEYRLNPPEIWNGIAKIDQK